MFQTEKSGDCRNVLSDGRSRDRVGRSAPPQDGAGNKFGAEVADNPLKRLDSDEGIQENPRKSKPELTMIPAPNRVRTNESKSRSGRAAEPAGACANDREARGRPERDRGRVLRRAAEYDRQQRRPDRLADEPS